MRREVTVDLNDFDSDDILEAAVDIVAYHLKSERPKEGYRASQWKVIEDLVVKMRDALVVKVAEIDDRNLPPPSTAAKIKSIAELREFVANNMHS